MIFFVIFALLYPNFLIFSIKKSKLQTQWLKIVLSILSKKLALIKNKIIKVLLLSFKYACSYFKYNFNPLFNIISNESLLVSFILFRLLLYKTVDLIFFSSFFSL